MVLHERCIRTLKATPINVLKEMLADVEQLAEDTYGSQHIRYSAIAADIRNVLRVRNL